jgi:hypothetical protein
MEAFSGDGGKTKEPALDSFCRPLCGKAYSTDRKIHSPHARPCASCARTNGIAQPPTWASDRQESERR